MKRQRSTPVNGTPPAEKPKKMVQKVKDDEVVAVAVPERREYEEDYYWDEWSLSSCLWAVGDEQMSWGTFWCPFWDMELMGELAYNALYSDVVWDEDIWDLKTVNQIPSTLM